MDKPSNTKFNFRLSSKLLDDFKANCRKTGSAPSSTLRALMMEYINASKLGYKKNKKFESSKKKKINENITIGEMYCGPGGIGLGAQQSKLKLNSKTIGYEHIWATDNHQDTCETYKKNFQLQHKNLNVLCEDIHKLKINNLPYVDGFLYGFPCNDFSNVGETKGLDGDYGPLYSYGIDYINNKNPKFIFAENVSGLSNANSGYAFSRIISELSSAGKFGYELTCHLYKFEDYGIPQARHRYIIIGFRKDLQLKFNVPKPSGIKNTAKNAITIPPINSNAPNQELTRQSKTVIDRLKHIKPGENAWTANLPSHLELNVKGAKLSMIYKRLNPDKPAYTVTGSGGGGTHMYHWKEPRALTNRERARLQTFPDDFKFYGSKESVRRQIGMAVPVKGAKIILEAVLKSLFNVDYDFIQPNVSIDDFIDKQSEMFK